MIGLLISGVAGLLTGVSQEVWPGEPVLSAPSSGSGPADSHRLRDRYGYFDVRHDSYPLIVDVEGPHFVDMTADGLDAYLVLCGPDGEVLAEDDDSGPGTDARLVLERLDPDREYVLHACALWGDGEYSVSLHEGVPSPPVDPREALDRARAVHERLEDGDPIAAAHAAGVLARALSSSGNDARALGLGRSAVRILEGHLATPASSPATTTPGEARRQALGPGQRAYVLRDKFLPPGSPEVGVAAFHYGRARYDAGLLRDTKPVLLQAERILTGEPDHLRELALALYFRADLELRTGQNRQGLVTIQRAIEALADGFGPTSVPLLVGLLCQARGLMGLARWSEAREVLERGMEIADDQVGYSEASAFRSQLVFLLLHQGHAGGARKLTEEALLRIAPGELQDSRAADVELTRTLFFNFLGLGDLSLESARRGLEHSIASAGLDHYETANFRVEYGRALAAVGRHEEALLEMRLAVEHLAAQEAGLMWVYALCQLAFVEYGAGNRDRSRQCLDRCLELLASYEEKEPPQLIDILRQMAVHHRDDGDYEESAAALHTCRRLIEAQCQPGSLYWYLHHDVNTTLQVELDHWDGAWDSCRSALAVREQRLDGSLLELSEFERFESLLMQRRGLEQLLGLLTLLPPSSDRELEAHQALLHWKGAASRLMVSARSRLLAGLTPEQETNLQELQWTQSRLSRIILATSAADLPDRRDQIVELQTRAGELERLLTDQDLANHRSAPPTPEWVRDHLPARSIYLDFFVHPTLHGPDSGLEWAERWGEKLLSVYVLLPERSDPVRVVLGPVAAMESAIQQTLRQITTGSREGPRGISVGKGTPEKDAMASLYRLLWSPLVPHVQGCDLVFVSADGPLHTLPFGVLRDPDGRHLVEIMDFVYVDDPRVLEGRPETDRLHDRLLAIGNVDYLRREQGAEGPPRADSWPLLRGQRSASWSPLPATGPEARAVMALHSAAFDAGYRALLETTAATEESLKRRMPGHSVLHIATHGFVESHDLEIDAGQGVTVQAHPGLLAGLVCAGADQTRDQGQEDGYLTAEEVTWLDLSSVDLAVLSACSTGLGRSQAGEGLIGLRRSFRLAGARTVISSLWSVEDDSTRRLMESFYTNLWQGKQGKLEALRNAKREMIREDRRRLGGRTEPSRWGAFTLSGDWR